MLSSFAVGAKNTVGIASRNSLDLDMIGSAGGLGAFYVVNTLHFYSNIENLVIRSKIPLDPETRWFLSNVTKNRKGVKTVITCSFFYA
jgi:hypothetical protein